MTLVGENLKKLRSAAGIPITDVSDRLGHASLNTTVQTYLHSDKSADSRISQCLDTFVKKAH